MLFRSTGAIISSVSVNESKFNDFISFPIFFDEDLGGRSGKSHPNVRDKWGVDIFLFRDPNLVDAINNNKNDRFFQLDPISGTVNDLTDYNFKASSMVTAGIMQKIDTDYGLYNLGYKEKASIYYFQYIIEEGDGYWNSIASEFRPGSWLQTFHYSIY